MSGKSLLIYICNFHVLSHFLLIYICKLHWNFKEPVQPARPPPPAVLAATLGSRALADSSRAQPAAAVNSSLSIRETSSFKRKYAEENPTRTHEDLDDLLSSLPLSQTQAMASSKRALLMSSLSDGPLNKPSQHRMSLAKPASTKVVTT